MDTSTGDTVGECVQGEVNCDCIGGMDGDCDVGGLCILGKCLPFTEECPYEIDGECDEGTFCDFGTDVFDCCATAKNNTCEEVGGGGVCPVYSDFFDCGYCPFVDDDECDEPLLCPTGTDVNDCS